MRLLVCGTRDWPGTWEDIAVHLPEDDDLTIIHGACSRIDSRGVQVSVDMIVDFVARGLGHKIERYPVNHGLDGPWPGAGPARNRRMLSVRPDRGLAFGTLWKMDKSWKRYRPTGTGHMVGLMLSANLTVAWVSNPRADGVDLTEMPAAPQLPS